MKIAEVLGSKGTEENIHAGKQVVEKHETTHKNHNIPILMGDIQIHKIMGIDS